MIAFKVLLVNDHPNDWIWHSDRQAYKDGKCHLSLIIVRLSNSLSMFGIGEYNFLQFAFNGAHPTNCVSGTNKCWLY